MKKLYYLFYNNYNTYYEIPNKHKKDLEKIINNNDIIQHYKEENTHFIQLDNNKKIMDFIKNI